MCVLGLASLSLSQLAAFSSDWLLNEGALQGNEHGTDQRDKKVLITQQSAENGIWASHAPSSSVTPGQMLTLWPFVILQNQPRVSHKQKIWVSYVPWEIKQQKKKTARPFNQLQAGTSLKTEIKRSETISNIRNLSFLWTKCKCFWAVHTFHIWKFMSFSVEHTQTSSGSINAQRLSQLHILFFCIIGMLKRKKQKWKMSNSCSTTQVICNFLLLEFKTNPLIRKALSIDFPVQSCRGAGVHPSCQGVERRVTSLTDIYAHPI